MNSWKLSAGTACLLGKKSGRSDAPPSTAYIMLGERCRNNCSFCAQARQSKAAGHLLSRVTWPEVEAAEAATAVQQAYAAGRLRRACFQVVNEVNGRTATLAALQELAGDGMPICVSGIMQNVAEAEELLAAGAERICIALDAATPEVYLSAKGGEWQEKWMLLTACAARFPGRITTHLIVGLGESEEDIVKVLGDCSALGITVGLFAFTPVRGTVWSNRLPPELGQYRRCQIAHRLLALGESVGMIKCRAGRIVEVELTEEELRQRLYDGVAFQTSGCPDCNRPFYNERPGGVMYNYPRPLTELEISNAIKESGISGR
ncbi:radical SAM protein [Azotosporobacter soli]|uniref:radical SAM protein n=1 Tax=Azotosporobacter soli TaxID=3055040 RepID=UPI0031FF336B